MSWLEGKKIWILSASAVGIMTIISIKIDKYEYSTIQNLNNTYSRLMINPETWKNLERKPKKDEWFSYYKNNEKYNQKIVNTTLKNNHYEVIMSGANFPEPITPISYKLKRSSIFNEIISL